MAGARPATAMTTASSAQASTSSTRRGRERKPADPGPVQAAIGQDARENRERGDRHRGAEEQDERRRVVRVVAVHEPGASPMPSASGSDDRAE